MSVQVVAPKVSTAPGIVPMSPGMNPGQRLTANDAEAFGQTLTLDDRLWMAQEIATNKGTVVTNDDLGNNSLFFNRSLEYIMSQAFDVQYEELPYRKMFDVVNEGGPGVKNITAEVYDHFGKANVINMGSQDVPFVGAGGREVSYPVTLFGIGAQWNMQELHAHAVAVRNGRGRRSPQQSRQQAAVRGMDETLNDQALYGTDEANIPGFINHPNIPRGTVAPGASTSTAWEDKTADEILADIDALGTSIWVKSKMIERPDTLALPPSKLALISQRRLDNRDISILSYLKENSLFFNKDTSFIAVNEYEGAGVGSTGLMTAYQKHQDKVRMEIPQEIQALPTQQQLFSYLMLYYAYSAGCMVLYPRSIEHAEGI